MMLLRTGRVVWIRLQIDKGIKLGALVGRNCILLVAMPVW